MKKALILIEFQNEWLRESGKLYDLIEDKNRMNRSMSKAKEMLEYARKNDFLIIHSGLSFSENYKELGIAKQGLRAHIPAHKTFQENESGSDFHVDFMPQEDELVVKGRLGSSAFAGSNLDSLLKNNQISEVYLMGYALHVCVESTFRAAHDLGYESNVIADACAAFNQTQEVYFKEEVAPHFGRIVMTNDLIKGKE